MAPSTRRDAYGRVKRALLYVASEVNGHLALVRLLDAAAAAGRGSSNGGNASSSPCAQQTIEDRYRCAFTAQVMAGARGDFSGTMRSFFDRNLRFWHRSWVQELRRGHGQEEHEDGGGEESLAGDVDGGGMDVSEDNGASLHQEAAAATGDEEGGVERGGAIVMGEGEEEENEEMRDDGGVSVWALCW